MAEYIDRNEYVKSLKESYCELVKIYASLDDEQEKKICEAQLITFTECILRIKDMPAADVVPVVHAKWIFNDDWWEFRCTHCHKAIGDIKKYKYCPYCGAKMDLE